MSVGDILTLIGGSSGGTAIVMLVLFVTGQIFSKSSYDDMKDQRDEWRRLYELEHARSEAGLIAGRIVADALSHAASPKEIG